MSIYADFYIGPNNNSLKEKAQRVTGLVEEWSKPALASETMEYVREIKEALYDVLNFLSE